MLEVSARIQSGFAMQDSSNFKMFYLPFRPDVLKCGSQEGFLWLSNLKDVRWSFVVFSP